MFFTSELHVPYSIEFPNFIFYIAFSFDDDSTFKIISYKRTLSVMKRICNDEHDAHHGPDLGVESKDC